MPTQPKKAKPAFGRPYYTLVLINALTSISFFTVNPIITKYLTGMGVALALATTIAGLFSLTALTVRPFTGVIADRISPLGILRLGIPLLTFSMVGYSLTRSTPLFVLFRILNGVAFCFNGTTVNAYACKFIPKERIGEGVGYLGLGNVIATASSLTAILLAAPLMAFGQGGGQPAAQAYCVKKLGLGRQGVATSTYYICADLFQGTGPIIGGFVVEGAGGNYAAAFYAAAALLVPGLACFLALDGLERKKEGRGG